MENNYSPRILLVAGFRKCGTSLLYSGLSGGQKLRTKDESWSAVSKHIAKWRESNSKQPLIIAKADALNCPDDLVIWLDALGPCSLDIVVVFRIIEDRFRSYIAHEEKYGERSALFACPKFVQEIESNIRSMEILTAKEVPVHSLRYESIINSTQFQVATDFNFAYSSVRKNTANQRIRLRSAVVPLLESRVGKFLLQTREHYPKVWSAMRKMLLNDSHIPKQSLRGIGIGQITGTPNGQQQMMVLALQLPEIEFSIDFRVHHWKPLAFIIALSKAAFLRATKRYDFVYFQPSRSTFGLIRDWAILRMAVSSNAKLVLHSHGYEMGGFYTSPGLTWMKQWILRRGNLLITCHSKIVHSEIKEMKQKGIDNPMLSALVPLKTLLIRAERERKYVFFSNFVPGKGLDVILRLLLDGLPPGELLVIGNEVEGHEAYYSTITRNLKNCGAIVLSNQTRSAIELELRHSEFLLFPSTYSSEAFPLTIAEAMNQGCIPLMIRHNALPQIFGDLGCIFTEFESYQELVFATSLTDAEKDKMISLNRAYIEELSVSRWSMNVRAAILSCFGVDLENLGARLEKSIPSPHIESNH